MKKFYVILILVLGPVMLFSSNTGKIQGKVTDKQTGDPLQGANINLIGTALRTSTDKMGEYQILNVPPGKYDMKVSMMGYGSIVKKSIHVKANKTTRVNFQLITSVIEGEAIAVLAAEEADYLEKRSRSHELSFSPAGSGRPLLPPPNYPDIIPPDFNTEEYGRIVENDFLEVLSNPLSTFSIDVDAASYANCRRYINMDQLPLKDAVRIEELINYFNYDYEKPEKDKPFSVNLEYGDCPWNKEHKLIHIGLKGKELDKEDQTPSNLVFLLDVSGSMNSPKKLPLLKKAFNLLVDQLKDNDRISIVVYAGAAGLVLPATPGSEKVAIKEAIERLKAGGSTAGGAGIELAYKTAKENFIKGGNNRVILATDGDFNIGFSSTSELVRFIEEKRDEGIFLTVLGFGMGNYKDNRLEQLADKGNGNHAYIDNILEARKVFVHEINATLFTIAKDVKIQVEFNPTKIHSYRLIGYENRLLKKEDFDDDTKDAGEIGAGHTVTALYEVVLADQKRAAKIDLKYQETKVKNNAEKTDEILTLKLRYKEPDGDKSTYFNTVLKGKPIELEKSSDNFKFSAAVAEFALLLRDSDYKGDADIKQVKKLAKSAMGEDPFGYRTDFLQMIEKAEILMK